MEYLQYNIAKDAVIQRLQSVLNLVINGIPSIPHKKGSKSGSPLVLNLVINGIPSIQHTIYSMSTFNSVLNLVINGIPSIRGNKYGKERKFSVLNLVINGIPSIPLIWIRILILWLFDSLFKG